MPGHEGKLVWVTFESGWGTQIMLVARDDGGSLRGWKWRDQGRKWTKPARILKSQIKGEITEEEMASAKVKRALAALKEQLSITMERK